MYNPQMGIVTLSPTAATFPNNGESDAWLAARAPGSGLQPGARPFRRPMRGQVFRRSSAAVATSRERHRWQRSDRRRNKQPDQNRNDGNDDQQRDERECLSHHTAPIRFGDQLVVTGILTPKP